MAQTVCVIVNDLHRHRLQAIAADRNRRQKHVERARIVLASADRGSAQRVAQSIGVSRPTVWRWQQRFAEAGVEGLLRDRTRKPGKAPIAADQAARIVALTCTQPPHEATHWTGRAMVKASGIAPRSVQRIWQAHQLQPHRLRTFKRSRDLVLVCRPRAADARTAMRREFVNVLKTELPVALKRLQHGNIAPVDLAQAAIGPGMAVLHPLCWSDRRRRQVAACARSSRAHQSDPR